MLVCSGVISALADASDVQFYIPYEIGEDEPIEVHTDTMGMGQGGAFWPDARWPCSPLHTAIQQVTYQKG